MKTQNIRVKLRDGEMGAYLAIPDRTPAGAIIAIMEIWGVNDTMRRHAHEFAQAGFICLVPDLFWRQESGLRKARFCRGLMRWTGPGANGGLPNAQGSPLRRVSGPPGTRP
jgi:dienelactone hydrolase